MRVMLALLAACAGLVAGCGSDDTTTTDAGELGNEIASPVSVRSVSGCLEARDFEIAKRGPGYGASEGIGVTMPDGDSAIVFVHGSPSDRQRMGRRFAARAHVTARVSASGSAVFVIAEDTPEDTIADLNTCTESGD